MKSDDLFFDQLEAVFFKDGLRALTVGDLAKRLRCSRRRLYAIAESKEGLFLAVCTRFFRKIQDDGWRLANARSDIGEKIAAYLHVGAIEARRLSDAFYRDINALKEGQAVFDLHQKVRIDGLQRLIDEGVQSGVFRGVHSRLIAEMMLATVKRAREPDFQRDTGLGFGEALDELSFILRHGLLHPDAEARASMRSSRRQKRGPRESLTKGT